MISYIYTKDIYACYKNQFQRVWSIFIKIWASIRKVGVLLHVTLYLILQYLQITIIIYIIDKVNDFFGWPCNKYWFKWVTW